MPSYLKPIHVPPCDWRGCTIRSTQTLFNGRNAPIGNYCAGHCQRALDEAREAGL